MAEQQKNKPKIDLRARLGKKTVGAAGPSIPPPMTTGQSTIPPAPRPSSPLMPSPGASIPSPPFAAKPSVAPSSSSFSPEPERPRYVEPQAIKIEMSDEVFQAQKKGRSKVIMIAAATAVVGAIIGMQFGGGLERRGRQNIAIEGAKMLTEEVDKANGQIAHMAEVLAEAKRSLSDGEYPEAALNKLAEAGISFDGTYLYGKGVGLMSPKLNKQLVDFAGKAAAANEAKESLHLVLSGNRKAITDIIEQSKAPKFNWSVYVMNGPHGPMAGMQPLPEPFLVTDKSKKDYKWPEEIEVPAQGDKKEKLKLYSKGDPVSSSPLLIPVEPGTQAAVCPNDVPVRLRREIEKLEDLLKGDKSDPTNEKAGLSDLGNAIIDQLKGIGVGG